MALLASPATRVWFTTHTRMHVCQAHTLVVVESPTKARKIGDFLGNDYVVKASYGHVRQLRRRNGVDPQEGFTMHWENTERAENTVPQLEECLKQAKHLILATDPDREGEAISWHLLELFKAQRALEERTVSRVAFSEITRDAVLAAMAAPRAVSQPLVDAYLARLAMDYLLGFTLSPLLWRKLPGPKSAGRVQSVALRLICDLEAKLEVFRPQAYYTVAGTLVTPSGRQVRAQLSAIGGKSVGRGEDTSREVAEAALEALTQAGRVVVSSVKLCQRKSSPSAPYTTSTLQQDASRFLGFSASKTMSIAQNLFEEGYSTYHRTDGVSVSPQRVEVIRDVISDTFGAGCLPASPRAYTARAKNAQEAHEAIVATDVQGRPELSHDFAAPARSLYRLIWLRTVASQMEDAQFKTARVLLSAGDGNYTLSLSSSKLQRDGYLAAWSQAATVRGSGIPDPEDDAVPEAEAAAALEGGGGEGAEAALDEAAFEEVAALRKGGELRLLDCVVEEHFTSAGGRFSEASLVKRLEELGIGRPSTYAGILRILSDRGYVTKEKRSLVPTSKGRILSTFLEEFFPTWVDYNFTSEMEASLDRISAGAAPHGGVLDAFWQQLTASVDALRDVEVSQVLSQLEARLAVSLFPPRDDGADSRQCPVCGTGRLHLRLSRTGAFVGCSNYSREVGEGGASCTYVRPLTFSQEVNDVSEILLGNHPTEGNPVHLRLGPYGWYVETLLNSGDLRRESLLVKEHPDSVTLDRAVELLSGPKQLGIHPDTGLPIELRSGRFGPYFAHGSLSKSLGKKISPADASIEDAMRYLDAKAASLGKTQAEAALAPRVGAKRKQPKGPAKPPTAYTAFLRSWRAETGGDLAAARKAWKALDPNEKARLKAVALASTPPAAPASGAEEVQKPRSRGAAAKPPAAYTAFLRSWRAETGGNLTAAREAWKALDPAEKARLKAEAIAQGPATETHMKHAKDTRKRGAGKTAAAGKRGPVRGRGVARQLGATDEAAPAKRSNAYTTFVKAWCEANSGGVKAAREAWNALSPAEKLRWKAEASSQPPEASTLGPAADASLKEGSPRKARQAAPTLASARKKDSANAKKAEKTEAANGSGAARRPSAYASFLKTWCEENAGGLRAAQQAWRDLGPQGQARYKEEALTGRSVPVMAQGPASALEPYQAERLMASLVAVASSQPTADVARSAVRTRSMKEERRVNGAAGEERDVAEAISRRMLSSGWKRAQPYQFM